MKAEQLLSQARKAMTVKRVFGEPYQQDDVTLIPVAKIIGGAGSGSGGDNGDSGGAGAGFGVRAIPAGVYVIRNGEVNWQPALDLNRIILGGQMLAALALLVARSIVKTRADR